MSRRYDKLLSLADHGAIARKCILDSCRRRALDRKIANFSLVQAHMESKVVFGFSLGPRTLLRVVRLFALTIFGSRVL